MHTIYIYTFRSTSYWLYLELNEMVSGLKKPWCAARQAQHRCEENGAMLLLLFEAWNALPQPIASLEKSGACLEIIDYQIAESFIHRSQCQQHWKKQWKPKTVEAAKTAARCRAKGAWGQVRRCKNFHWSDYIYIYVYEGYEVTKWCWFDSGVVCLRIVVRLLARKHLAWHERQGQMTRMKGKKPMKMLCKCCANVWIASPLFFQPLPAWCGLYHQFSCQLTLYRDLSVGANFGVCYWKDTVSYFAAQRPHHCRPMVC